MNYSQRNTRSSLEVLADTNIIFSALLYPCGNPRRVFDLAAKKMIPLIILDYVKDEALGVLAKKGLNIGGLAIFLRTYPNPITRSIEEITDEDMKAAHECVVDKKDLPIFAYFVHRLDNGFDSVLVTGDKGLLNPAAMKRSNGRILTAVEALEHLKSIG